MRISKPSRRPTLAILALFVASLAIGVVAEAEEQRKKKNRKRATQTSEASQQKKGGQKKKKAQQSGGSQQQNQGAAQADAGLPAPPAVVKTANRHLLAYDTAAARAALDGATAPADAWVETARGWLLTQEAAYDAAETKLRQAADADPRNPAPLLSLGDTLSYADKSAAAGTAFANAEKRAATLVADAPENAEALYYLGVAQQRQKRFDEGATKLTRALELGPDAALAPLVHYQLGVTRFYQQRWQEAFDALGTALEKNSGIALAYYYRGLAAGKLNRKDLLIDNLDRFVRMAPNAPEAANAAQVLSAYQ